MLGHRDDVETVLGALDLLLLTSAAEGIPGIVIEAQMAGCPVVTYPVGAVASVVDDGHTGVVLARADPQLMADAVVQLLGATRSPSAMLGVEGRRRADEFSTATRAAAAYRTAPRDALTPDQIRPSADRRFDPGNDLVEHRRRAIVVASKPEDLAAPSRSRARAAARRARTACRTRSGTARPAPLIFCQIISASSSTVVDCAVERLKSSFSAAGCSIAVTMPRARSPP